MIKLILLLAVLAIGISTPLLIHDLRRDEPPEFCTKEEAVASAKAFLNLIGLENDRLGWSYARIELGGVSEPRWEIDLPACDVWVGLYTKSVNSFRLWGLTEKAPSQTPRDRWAARSDEQALTIADRFAKSYGLTRVAPRVTMRARHGRGREYVVVTDPGYVTREPVFGGRSRWSVEIDRATGVITEFDQFRPLRFDWAPIRVSQKEARRLATIAYEKLKPGRPSASEGGDLGWAPVEIIEGKEVIDREWQPLRVRLAFEFRFQDGRLVVYVDANSREVIKIDEYCGTPQK
jgi:hypothetical protein